MDSKVISFTKNFGQILDRWVDGLFITKVDTASWDPSIRK